MLNLLTLRLVNRLNYPLTTPLSPYTLPLLISVVRLTLSALRALLLIIAIAAVSTIRAL